MKQFACSRFGAVAIVFALASAACGDDSTEKGAKLIERVASDVEANQPDCDKIGSALAAHLDEDAALMKQIKALDAAKSLKQRLEDRAAAEAKYGERMKVAKAKIKGPFTACRGNEKIRAYGEQVLRP